jgi:hypothetical protein
MNVLIREIGAVATRTAAAAAAAAAAVGDLRG